MMLIYLLKRIGAVDYDEVRGMVVIASDPWEARRIAADASCDEGPNVWRDEAMSSCLLIGQSTMTATGVVLVDFKAG